MNDPARQISKKNHCGQERVAGCLKTVTVENSILDTFLQTAQETADSVQVKPAFASCIEICSTSRFTFGSCRHADNDKQNILLCSDLQQYPIHNLSICPLLRSYTKHLVLLQAELKEELAAKTAAISLLETTVTSLGLLLEEKREEWQGGLENLEEQFRTDKARLEDQLAALIAEKVLFILLALSIAYRIDGIHFVCGSCNPICHFSGNHASWGLKRKKLAPAAKAAMCHDPSLLEGQCA